MVVYEAVDYYNTFYLNHKIVKRWEQNFTEFNGGIHDFDILEGNYIVLYTGDDETYVYQIEMQIYWTYRMILPLFEQYSNYQYFSSTVSSLVERRIVRSYASEYLTLLLASKDKNEYMMFFYSFKTSQHDSLIMVQNVTEFYAGT